MKRSTGLCRRRGHAVRCRGGPSVPLWARSASPAPTPGCGAPMRRSGRSSDPQKVSQRAPGPRGSGSVPETAVTDTHPLLSHAAAESSARSPGRGSVRCADAPGGLDLCSGGSHVGMWTPGVAWTESILGSSLEVPFFGDLVRQSPHSRSPWIWHACRADLSRRGWAAEPRSVRRARLRGREHLALPLLTRDRDIGNRASSGVILRRSWWSSFPTASSSASRKPLRDALLSPPPEDAPRSGGVFYRRSRERDRGCEGGGVPSRLRGCTGGFLCPRGCAQAPERRARAPHLLVGEQ